MSEIRVGMASVDFTPEAGLPLMGNFRDDYAARGSHDPLFAKAIVFAEGATKLGLLAVDLCLLDRENVRFLREIIGSSSEIPPQNVLIHATHTHSAPAANGQIGLAAEVASRSADIEALLRRAAAAVVYAARDLQDARLEAGCAHEDRVSFNRRLRRPDNTTQMNWTALQHDFDPSEIVGAWGPVDPELVCLTVRRERAPAATLVNFGLHPAILAGDNWLYSADYPGYVAEAMSRIMGDDFTCLYLNGCCGDVNHVDYRDPLQGRGFQMAQRVGYMLAATAQQAMNGATPIQGRRVGVSRELVELKRLSISERECERCEQILDRARSQPPRGQVDGVPDAYYARIRLDMRQMQDQPDHVEVMVTRIGDAAIVGLPGEAFCESGLEIKRRSPARHTLVAGLSNDAIGYLPTREAFRQGGYETTVGSTFYEAGSAERIVASALTQLERLFSNDNT